MSTHINSANIGDIAETVLLPGDPLRAKYIAENYLENVKCYSEVRNMLGFTGTYKSVPVSVQGTGMGMPSMGIYSYELIHDYNCKNLIRIGTAGSFIESMGIGDIVIAIGASTDSNYAHTYELNGTYAPTCSFKLMSRVWEASGKTGIKFKAGNVVSCDVFYEQNPDWWKAWARMGVLAVEMEAAALYMNAAAGGAEALAIMTISDNFVTNEKATTEEREKNFTEMMELALETAVLSAGK